MTLHLIFLYLRRIISYYIEGKAGSLADIVRIEEGFYHDLKGLYTKRLGLPVNKFKSGDHDGNVIEDILSGARDVVVLFDNNQGELIQVLPPNFKLVSIFKQVARLPQLIKCRKAENVVSLLEKIKENSFSFYEQAIKSSSFELKSLLNQIVSGIKADKRIKLKLDISNQRQSMRLPYADYSTWRRIFQNFIINAIEACEMKENGGEVFIKLSYDSAEIAKIEIADTGIGMDEQILENFTKRGYTKGKTSGQGLGVNEDTIEFINRNGNFAVRSILGTGTSITIELDGKKASGATLKRYLIHPSIWRWGRYSAAMTILLFAAYWLYSMAFGRIDNYDTFDIGSIELADEDSLKGKFHVAIAKDNMGNERWKVDLGQYFIPTEHLDLNSYFMLLDINNDGYQESILPFNTLPWRDKGKQGLIKCFDRYGKELWKIDVGPNRDKASILGVNSYNAGSFTPRKMDALTLNDDLIIYLTATADDYPCQFLIINSDGGKLKEYWHTGHLIIFPNLGDFHKNESDLFLLYGQNNEIGWSPVIIVLSYGNVYGQSIPYKDPDLLKGEEDIYYVIGHAWVNEGKGFQGANNYPINNAAVEKVSIGYNYLDNENKMECKLSDGRVVRFNENFEIESINIDTAQFSKWWNLRRIGGYTYRNWNHDDIRQLYGYRKYVKGELQIDSITINQEYYNPEYWQSKLAQ